MEKEPAVRLSAEEVRHIALLARVGLSDEEVETLRDQLSKTLEYFQILRKVNTENMPPTSHAVPMENIFREDSPRPSYPQEEILLNAPAQEEGAFKVKAVLE